MDRKGKIVVSRNIVKVFVDVDNIEIAENAYQIRNIYVTKKVINEISSVNFKEVVKLQDLKVSV